MPLRSSRQLCFIFLTGDTIWDCIKSSFCSQVEFGPGGAAEDPDLYEAMHGFLSINVEKQSVQEGLRSQVSILERGTIDVSNAHWATVVKHWYMTYITFTRLAHHALLFLMNVCMYG